MGLVPIVELASFAILTFAVGVAARHGQWRMIVVEGALVSLGGLVGEATILRWYGFYRYDNEWSLFVDLMPVTVALVWGYVLASARLLAATFHPSRPAWLVGLLVLFDAALIEPVASRAGLWRWDEGGLWSVPWIGVLGWGLYAMAASWCLDRPKLRRMTPLLAPAFTHVALLALWWGGFRWFGRSVAPDAVLVVASVVGSAALTVLATRVTPPALHVLGPRVPAGLLFFAIVPFTAPSASFVAYVLPFAAPWLVLSWRAWKQHESARS